MCVADVATPSCINSAVAAEAETSPWSRQVWAWDAHIHVCLGVRGHIYACIYDSCVQRTPTVEAFDNSAGGAVQAGVMCNAQNKKAGKMGKLKTPPRMLAHTYICTCMQIFVFVLFFFYKNAPNKTKEYKNVINAKEKTRVREQKCNKIITYTNVNNRIYFAYIYT